MSEVGPPEELGSVCIDFDELSRLVLVTDGLGVARLVVTSVRWVRWRLAVVGLLLETCAIASGGCPSKAEEILSSVPTLVFHCHFIIKNINCSLVENKISLSHVRKQPVA